MFKVPWSHALLSACFYSIPHVYRSDAISRRSGRVLSSGYLLLSLTRYSRPGLMWSCSLGEPGWALVCGPLDGPMFGRCSDA